MIDYGSFFSRSAERMKESPIRRMGTVLAHGTDIVSFAPGYPAAETFAWAEFREIARELLSGADGAVLQYGPTRGHRPLLEAIAGILEQRGIETDVGRLLVTTGSQQGLDLVARVLLDPDDVVLVELPTYTGAITAFRNVQAAMVGVPQEADGIDLAALDETYDRLTRAGRRVRLVYLVPNFQNPTGLLIGLRKRRQLLEWLSRRNLLLLEDDPYRDLYFTDATSEADVRSIRAEDEEGRVVYLSSFSKTIAPGYRVAWIDAPAPLLAKIEVAKQAEDLCTGGFDQRMILEACRRGILAKQLPLLRAHYQQKRDVMVEALRSSFGAAVSWPDPRGGFFLWASLPPEVNADAMIPRAVQHGVIYVAGEAFYVDEPEDGPRGQNIVRLSFSAPSPERIREGVRRLAAAVDEEVTARRRQAAPPGALSPSPAAR
jgi:2-aminoadipate transaminase